MCRLRWGPNSRRCGSISLSTVAAAQTRETSGFQFARSPPRLADARQDALTAISAQVHDDGQKQKNPGAWPARGRGGLETAPTVSVLAASGGRC